MLLCCEKKVGSIEATKSIYNTLSWNNEMLLSIKLCGRPVHNGGGWIVNLMCQT